jgi:hypothetical protein
MAKQFIVRLRTGSPTGPIVANSQVITVEGLGSGPIAARDFADGALTGIVNTSAQSGGFYKQLNQARWALISTTDSTIAGNDIILNWIVTIPDTEPALRWYAVEPDSLVKYTGPGLVSNTNTSILNTAGFTSSINVSTKPIESNRQVQFTLWNGEFNIGKLLARSPTVRLVAKELDVAVNSSAVYASPIPMIISGYPNELVEWIGGGSASGIRGNVTLDSTGKFYVPDLRGGFNTPPNTYTYRFDGNLTANQVEKRITITADYILAWAVDPPGSAASGEPINISIKGAPGDTINYTGPTNGSILLNSVTGIGNQELLGSTTLSVNTNPTWQFDPAPNSKTFGSLTLQVKITSARNLTVTMPASANELTSFITTITGALNERVDYKYQTPNFPVPYLDYYEDAAAGFATSGTADPEAYATNHYNEVTAQGQSRLTNQQLKDLPKPVDGFVILDTDIGGGLGSKTIDLSGGIGFRGRKTRYAWNFVSSVTQDNITKDIKINRGFTLSVRSEPTYAEKGKPVNVTVYGAPNERVDYGGASSGYFIMPATGEYTFDIARGLTSLNVGNTYNWLFSGNISDPDNVPYSCRIVSSIDFMVEGPSTVTPNQDIIVKIYGQPGETVEYTYQPPVLSVHPYLDIYDDVYQAFMAQNYGISNTSIYATSHFEQYGSQENRISPASAQSDFDTKPIRTAQLTQALTRLTDGTERGYLELSLGKFDYGRTSSYTWNFKGNKTNTNWPYTVSVKSGRFLGVTAPATSQIDTLLVTITGFVNEQVTIRYVEVTTTGISKPITSKGIKIVTLASDGSSDGGVWSGDILAGSDGLSDMESGVVNNFRFDGNKTPNSIEKSVTSAAVSIITGRGYLIDFSDVSGSSLFQNPVSLSLSDGSGTYAVLPSQACWLMFAVVGGGGGGGGYDGDGAGGSILGGSGMGGGLHRGIVKLPATATAKTLVGVIGRGGAGGKYGGLPGTGGGGATISATGTIINGSGGNGGAAGTAGSSGSGGGGGGASVLAFRTGGTSDVIPVASASGGGGGGGASLATLGGSGRTSTAIPASYGVTGTFSGFNAVYHDDGIPLRSTLNGLGEPGESAGSNDGGGGGGGAGGGGLKGFSGRDGPGTVTNPISGVSNSLGGTGAYQIAHKKSDFVWSNNNGYHGSGIVPSTVYDIRNFYGYGGQSEGKGTNGAIAVFWTTASLAPADWSLLPRLPDPVVIPAPIPVIPTPVIPTPVIPTPVIPTPVIPVPPAVPSFVWKIPTTITINGFIRNAIDDFNKLNDIYYTIYGKNELKLNADGTARWGKYDVPVGKELSFVGDFIGNSEYAQTVGEWISPTASGINNRFQLRVAINDQQRQTYKYGNSGGNWVTNGVKWSFAGYTIPTGNQFGSWVDMSNTGLTIQLTPINGARSATSISNTPYDYNERQKGKIIIEIRDKLNPSNSRQITVNFNA